VKGKLESKRASHETGLPREVHESDTPWHIVHLQSGKISHTDVSVCVPYWKLVLPSHNIRKGKVR